MRVATSDAQPAVNRARPRAVRVGCLVPNVRPIPWASRFRQLTFLRDALMRFARAPPADQGRSRPDNAHASLSRRHFRADGAQCLARGEGPVARPLSHRVSGRRGGLNRVGRPAQLCKVATADHQSPAELWPIPPAFYRASLALRADCDSSRARTGESPTTDCSLPARNRLPPTGPTPKCRACWRSPSARSRMHLQG